MSSLLQHDRGVGHDGRVRLLLYKKREEVRYNCTSCRQTVDGPDHTHCPHCKERFVWRYERQEDGTWKHTQKFQPGVEYRGRDLPTLRRSPRDVDVEQFELTRPGGKKTEMPVLYRIYRKPKGTWGCWVVFRIAGEDRVPDLSTPQSYYAKDWPKDAERLTDEEATAYWNS